MADEFKPKGELLEGGKEIDLVVVSSKIGTDLIVANRGGC